MPACSGSRPRAAAAGRVQRQQAARPRSRVHIAARQTQLLPSISAARATLSSGAEAAFGARNWRVTATILVSPRIILFSRRFIVLGNISQSFRHVVLKMSK
ncbi:unnamed protein product [Lampetra planeri]